MLRTLVFFLLLSLLVSNVWSQTQQPDSVEQQILQQLKQPDRIKDYDKFINSVKDFSERNPTRGKDYAQKVLQLCEQMTSPKKPRYIAEALNALGSVHVLQDRLDSAFLLYSAALKIEAREQNLTNMASLTNNLGLIFSKRGQTDSAQKYYFKALKMYEQIKSEPLGIARSQNNLGRIYDTKGIFDSAMVFYEQSLRIREKIGDKVAASTVLDNMAIVQGKMGNYDTAIGLALKALQIHEATQDKYGQGFSLNSLGYLYQRQGNYDAALRYYLQALAIREQLGAKNAVIVAHNNLGVLHRLRGEYDLALQYFLKAIKLSESLGNTTTNLPNLFNNVGSLYTYKNLPDSALLYFSKSLNIYTKTKVPQGLASLYNNIAGVFLKRRQFDSALFYSLKAISIADSVNARPEKIDIYQGLSSIYEAMGEHKKALDFERLKIIIRDSLFNEQKSKQIAELQTKYDVERKDKTITLLTKDNAISELLLKNQESDLLRERITSENRRQQMTLLQSEKEISELRSRQNQTALREQKLLATQQNQQFSLLSQEKILNETTLRQQVLVRNGFIGGAVAIAIILGLLMNRYRIKKNTEEQLRLKNEQIALLEQERLLADERGRIAKDIHDEVGPGMMKIALLAQNVEENVQQLDRGKIADTAEDVINSMNGIIWMTNPKNDTLDNLAAYIQEKAGDWFDRIGANKGMVLDFVLPEDVPALALEGTVRRNLYLSVKEALNNALKHSEASRVEISLTMLGEKSFAWRVSDNGRGFEATDVSRFSNGLANMRSRLEEIGGECLITSHAGQGTSITFRMEHQTPNTDFSR